MGSWGRVESKKVDWTQSALEKMWHALYNMGSNTYVGIEKICKCWQSHSLERMGPLENLEMAVRITCIFDKANPSRTAPNPIPRSTSLLPLKSPKSHHTLLRGHSSSSPRNVLHVLPPCLANVKNYQKACNIRLYQT